MPKVTLRTKPITKGRSTYYLDHYPPLINPKTGKSQRREYLKLYVFDNPKTDADRLHNRETKKLLEHIRATRQIDVQNQEFGFLSDEQKNAVYYGELDHLIPGQTDQGNVLTLGLQQVLY